jgi:hypothetical protein
VSRKKHTLGSVIDATQQQLHLRHPAGAHPSKLHTGNNLQLHIGPLVLLRVLMGVGPFSMLPINCTHPLLLSRQAAELHNSDSAAAALFAGQGLPCGSPKHCKCTRSCPRSASLQHHVQAT